MFRTQPQAHLNGTRGRLGWTSGDIPSSGAITGHDAITLALRLLISTGYATNYSGSGTNYDAYERGIGLGIPYQRVDITGCEAVQSQFDFDTNVKLILSSFDGVWAKRTIEQHILRPFGCFFTFTKSGQITIKRPKNPEKYYVSPHNQTLSFKLPTTGTEYDATLNVGVYNPNEMATEVARALNATATSGWECDYGGGTANTIRVRNTGDSWDLIYDSGSDQGWQTIGYDQGVVNTAANTYLEADNTTAVFSGITLTEDDLFDVRMIPNTREYISSVMWFYDHGLSGLGLFGNPQPGGIVRDPENDQYMTQRWYINAETVNLGGPLLDHIHEIKSKCLFSGAGGSYSMWTEPSSGCDPEQQDPSGGIDDDGWIQLVSAHLLDRFLQPPPRFAAKLPWRLNTLEHGDQVQVTYPIAGKLIDRELGLDTLTTRTFDIVRIRDEAQRGYVPCEFLGHRSPDTPSVSVSVRGN